MAPRIEFHTGVTDAQAFACRLLRKAYRQGARVVVRAPSAVLARLDRELWTFAERDFVPHLRFAQPGPVPPAAARTPIWLVDGELPVQGCPPVLVNLGADRPAAPHTLQRVVEVVSADPADAQAGRERFRAWRADGCEVHHHAAAAGDGA